MPAVLFDFGAMPPEVNSARLRLGPGPAPMAAVAESYAHAAVALLTMAAESAGAMGALESTWRGPAASRAQSAFRNHGNWLQQQAGVAVQAASSAAGVASACAAAHSTMPPFEAIMANRAAATALTATNSAGQNTAAIAANEAVYMGMWIAAAATMYTYAAGALTATAALQPPIPPPPITAGGTGHEAVQTFGDLGAGDPGPLDDTGHTLERLADTGGGGGDTGTDPGGTDPGPKDVTQPTDPGGNPGSDITNPPAEPPQSPGDPAQALGDVERAGAGLPDAPAETAQGGAGDMQDQHGFFGTSPYSSTLAALNGGALAAAGGLGLITGGLGALAGSATGFRMPRTWTPGTGTAFGAVPNAPSAAPVGRQAPRGVIAPKATMRRRRDEERDEQATVFVPGGEPEVPLLAELPVFGVISYDEEPQEDRFAAGEEHPVGVLEPAYD